MTPLWMFILFLGFIGVSGIIVLIKSVLWDKTPLNKGDVYLRGSIFLMSLFLALTTMSGVYYGNPVRIENTDSFTYVLAFEPYVAIIPFVIAVVSLFATVYAWLSVFGKKREGEI